MLRAKNRVLELGKIFGEIWDISVKIWDIFFVFGQKVKVVVDFGGARVGLKQG